MWIFEYHFKYILNDSSILIYLLFVTSCDLMAAALIFVIDAEFGKVHSIPTENLHSQDYYLLLIIKFHSFHVHLTIFPNWHKYLPLGISLLGRIYVQVTS